MTVYLDLNNNGQLDADEPAALTSEDDPATTGVDESSPAFPPATGPEASFDDMGWLAEYEQMATRPHRSKDSLPAAAAVDQLLATYWP